MNRWERIVDKLVTDIIGDGDVSHLPGAGKRLKLKHDSNTPGEWRAAMKIMQDHHVMPDWITAGKALEDSEAKLRCQLISRARRYLRASSATQVSGVSLNREQIDSSWRRYIEDFRERIRRYNRDLLLYNLRLPKGIPHKQTLRGEALIKRALQNARTET